MLASAGQALDYLTLVAQIHLCYHCNSAFGLSLDARWAENHPVIVAPGPKGSTREY